MIPKTISFFTFPWFFLLCHNLSLHSSWDFFQLKPYWKKAETKHQVFFRVVWWTLLWPGQLHHYGVGIFFGNQKTNKYSVRSDSQADYHVLGKKKITADLKTLSLWFWVSAWLTCNTNNYANFNFQEIIWQIVILLLQYYLPCSNAPAVNCHMEEEASKWRVEKQAQNVPTKWKPICTFCLYSLKAQQYKWSTDCQNCKKKTKKKKTKKPKTIHFICIYISMSDLAKNKNAFVDTTSIQANSHHIHLAHYNIFCY